MREEEEEVSGDWCYAARDADLAQEEKHGGGGEELPGTRYIFPLLQGTGSYKNKKK